MQVKGLGLRVYSSGFRDPSAQIIPLVENQMEKNMENDMETVVIRGYII